MPATLNLTQASMEQVHGFFNSFDVVLSDCDGVIWYLEKPIPGAMTALNKLQKLGKKLYLVTNNSTISMERYCEKLKLNGLNVKPDQIINPAKAITWYLHKIKFSGEAFVIAAPAFRQIMTDSGIKLALEDPNIVEGDPQATLKAFQDQPSIKAVVVDFSLYFDWAKSAFAICCLNRNDVIYICGAQDEWIPCGANIRILGPGPLINVITKQSGKAPIECAKPSEMFKDFLVDFCKLKDPQKCLFIGDTINNDMKFGTMCGFKKLFVDTGVDNVVDSKRNKETCPDFYIPSLGLLHPIIDSLHNDSVEDKDGC